MKPRFWLLIAFVSFSVSLLAGDEIDLISPEATLASYLKCYETADVDCVLTVFHGISSFYIDKACTIEHKIQKQVIFGEKEVKNWNSIGIFPRAKIADVQLQVWKRCPEYEGMWSYNLRKIDCKWYIISHAGWGVVSAH